MLDEETELPEELWDCGECDGKCECCDQTECPEYSELNMLKFYRKLKQMAISRLTRQIQNLDEQIAALEQKDNS